MFLAPAVSSSVVEPRPAGSHFMAGLMVFATVATAVYWTIWFFVDRLLLANAQTESYFTFENAFPAADAWLAVTALLGAIAVWRRRSSAMLWLLCSGSACIYLALMDILFDLENGIYFAPDKVGVGIEVAINVFALVGGAAGIAFAWKHRAYFLRLDARANQR